MSFLPFPSAILKCSLKYFCKHTRVMSSCFTVVFMSVFKLRAAQNTVQVVLSLCLHAHEWHSEQSFSDSWF